VSENILNAILYSSKEAGVDPQDQTDHDIMYYRLGIVHSDKVPFVVESIEDYKNFAATLDPRLRELFMNDARTYRNMMSSYGSIKGRTLSMINTNTQQHTLTQKNVNQKKGWNALFQAKEQSKQPGEE